MRRTLMRSKIHRAVVTEANLSYAGSITIDRALMDAADLVTYEQVHVLDVDNGARFETYVIEGPAGSGTVCVNGAAARLVQPGDRIIVISYGSFDEAELAAHEPRIVSVDEHNRVVPLLREA